MCPTAYIRNPNTRRAYYRAARQIHPDVNPGIDTSDQMRRLNQAWVVLGDPEARRSYDRRRRRSDGPGPVGVSVPIKKRSKQPLLIESSSVSRAVRILPA